MNNKIKEIVSKNAKDLVVKRQTVPLDTLKKQVVTVLEARDFYQSLLDGYIYAGMGMITEIKLASPTEEKLGDATQIEKRAKLYEDAGADAISIVTEKYFFQGDSAFVQKVKNVVSLPVLQKDFIVDVYQIYEARMNRADALLLIVKLLDEEKLHEFIQRCFDLGMEPVVEINDEKDLEKALKTKTRVIAVNARDLDTFTVDVAKACELLKRIPDTFLKLGFSGIQSKEQVAHYKNAGAKGVLVGTSLMKSENIRNFIKELRSI